jgi:putative membrane protein
VDPSRFFSEADRRAVSEATREAERRTSGEIVPYVVGSCDDYSGAAWKAAVCGALAGAACGLAIHVIGDFWGGSPALWVMTPALFLGVLGFCLCRGVAAVRRSFVPDEILDLRARRRAAVAFLEEEVFLTRDRTGILIFVALFERRVVVLGDEGINRVVPDGAWQRVVADVIEGIKAGRPAAALIDAIADCGRLLETHRVDLRTDDRDELDNLLRLRER